MNYFVFLPASEAKNSKDKRRSVYKSDYLDIRLKHNMSDEESGDKSDNIHQEDEEHEEHCANEINDGMSCVLYI